MGTGGFRLFAFALAISASVAAAQTTAPAAAMAAIPEGELKATITAVQGLVQVRQNETAEWQSAKAGTVVGQGAEFRTGPRSVVRLEIPSD